MSQSRDFGPQAAQMRSALERYAKEELVDLRRRLGRRAYEYTRRKESEFGDAGLDASSSEDTILDAVVAAPILMERPILIRGRRAVIGRPPEDVLSLLGD